MITTIVFALMRVILIFSLWFYFNQIEIFPPIYFPGSAGFIVGLCWFMTPPMFAYLATKCILPGELETLTLEGMKG
jgi:hypothetical protein